MGRPLRRDTIVKMGLTASDKPLGKQVGYNKYLVKEDDENDKQEIVRLAEEKNDERGELVLKINGKKVLKVLRNIIQTADEIIPYTRNDEGKMVIDGKVITFDSVSETPSESVSETTVVEETVAKTEEVKTVAKKSKK